MFLQNGRLLDLEGHDLICRWHGYWWYPLKLKVNREIKNHYFRCTLLRIWILCGFSWCKGGAAWVFPGWRCRQRWSWSISVIQGCRFVPLCQC